MRPAQKNPVPLADGNRASVFVNLVSGDEDEVKPVGLVQQQLPLLPCPNSIIAVHWFGFGAHDRGVPNG